MISQLDTNVLLHYVRDDALSHKIETQYQIIATGQPLISVVTEAEMRTLAEEFTWGAGKRRRLENVLSLCTIVPIPFGNVVDAYVEISEYSRRVGRAMGKNDLWIAATAMVTGATLLTTDRDFTHLSPLFLILTWIDPTL
jgi:tRNA(fMet)-specific endonuclease VapC